MIENSIDTTIEISFSLNRRLDELNYKDYPSNTSIDLIKLFKSINGSILEKLIKQKDELQNPSVEDENKLEYEESVRRQIITYNYLLSYLHQSIQFIEESSTDHISLGTIYPIESIIEKFKPKSRFILRPDWDFNYSFFELTDSIRDTFMNVVPNIENTLNDFKEGLAILSFPSTEKNNIFFHCALSHEIGHFFITNNNSIEGIISDIKLDDILLNSIINKELQTSGSSESLTDKNLIRAKIIETCSKIIESWIQEISADLFAIHIFGPCYLFALSKIMIDRLDLDYNSEDHPSARYRIKLLLQELRYIGYCSSLKKRGFYSLDEEKKSLGEEVLSEIDKVNNDIKNVKIKPNADIFFICYDAIKKVLDELKEEVRKEVESADFDIENFKKEIPALVLAIENFITPNETIDFNEKTTKPANLISILNAGWIFYLTRKEKFFENLEENTLAGKLNMISKLNDMILKAIELSQAHEMWLQSIALGDEKLD